MLKQTPDAHIYRVFNCFNTISIRISVGKLLKKFNLTGLAYTYHIPDKVGQPVEQRLHSADKLHVFCFIHSLLNEKHHKTGRDEGHGEDDADGHQNIN